MTPRDNVAGGRKALAKREWWRELSGWEPELAASHVLLV